MPYDRDKTFNDHVEEVGQLGRRLRRTLTELAEQKVDWDGFKDGRTKGEVAIDLGRHANTGTAQAGAATTVTLATGASAVDDFYNGMCVEILSGSGVGEEKTITDYNGSTKVATVDTAWTTNPDSASVYVVQVDIDNMESAINNGNKLKRVAFGDIAQTPSSDLMANIRKFT